jgi:hypothetical protein
MQGDARRATPRRSADRGLNKTPGNHFPMYGGIPLISFFEKRPFLAKVTRDRQDR